MKIAIIGYGRMGKEVEAVAHEKGHYIQARIDNARDWDQQADVLRNADVAIEFSIPQNAVSNILKCFDLNLPVVCGTTGWTAQMDQIKEICLKKNQSFIYAPNFSVGVNVFFETNKHLAKQMKNFRDYEISIEEAHHILKLDAPSGTAIRLANDIAEEIDHKKGWSGNQNAGAEEIGITSIREGSIPGVHTVLYESPFDSIEITHKAKSRKGFAVGAMMAAEWIADKKGFFGMSDFLKTIIK